jgi:hypothetical protein
VLEFAIADVRTEVAPPASPDALPHYISRTGTR